MQNIPLDFVRKWRMNGPIRSPLSVSTICPCCGEKVVFSLDNHVDDSARRTTAATASCPSCNKAVQFWAIREGKAPTTSEKNPVAVYMYPPAKAHYPIPELSPDIPDPLKRAIVSTIEAFNARNYAATAVCGRRTLEGIFKYLVSEEKRKTNLAKLIELATDEIDLAAPLRTLSHAIRDGGNLGAHFDTEKEPTEPLARQMVELLDYLISYLYVLPKEIKKLEQSLGKAS